MKKWEEAEIGEIWNLINIWKKELQKLVNVNYIWELRENEMYIFLNDNSTSFILEGLESRISILQYIFLDSSRNRQIYNIHFAANWHEFRNILKQTREDYGICIIDVIFWLIINQCFINGTIGNDPFRFYISKCVCVCIYTHTCTFLQNVSPHTTLRINPCCNI